MSTELLIVLGLFVGLTGSFRWIFHKVTGEVIGWYDSIVYLLFAGLLKRIFNWGFDAFDFTPGTFSNGIAFGTWGLVFYVMLRQWHNVTPKHAWIIMVSWFSILMLTIVGFLMANQSLFA